VVIVHAYASPPDLPSAANRQQIIEERRVNGRDLLAKATARCKEAAGDATCETELVEGAAPEALLAVARDRDAREILVGSRGSGRSWTPIGSVSRQLLNSADRPVVVVPATSSR
jgi:nucleotide-binding universal stress UspA family protein